jgi:DNA-binding XRE family transcriptional regulator
MPPGLGRILIVKSGISEFGNALMMYRVASGLSQKDLAVSAGVSQGTISAYERGKTWPILPVWMRIARKLDIQTDSMPGIHSE